MINMWGISNYGRKLGMHSGEREQAGPGSDFKADPLTGGRKKGGERGGRRYKEVERKLG